MHMANASVMCSLNVKGINMEPYYYTKMSKPKQAVYHAIYQVQFPVRLDAWVMTTALVPGVIAACKAL